MGASIAGASSGWHGLARLKAKVADVKLQAPAGRT